MVNLTSREIRCSMANRSFFKLGTTASFRTDGAISSSRPGRERPLQPWVDAGGSNDVDLSLEKSTSSVPWDQFAVNATRFGYRTTYDENIYTTPINKSHPQYNQRLQAAEKKAQEIERSNASTSHVAEERKMDFAGSDEVNGDEEDK